MIRPLPPGALALPAGTRRRGRSSGVERNLAKVEVEGSNPFARSINSLISLDFLKYPLGAFGSYRQNAAGTGSPTREKSGKSVCASFSRAGPERSAALSDAVLAFCRRFGDCDVRAREMRSAAERDADDFANAAEGEAGS